MVSDVLTDLQSNGELSATYEYVRGTVTDANGNAAATDLVSKITYSDGSERLYTYDANGNILTVSLKKSSTSAAKTEASYTY